MVCSLFALSVVIYIACVKIVVACFEESIYHLVELFIIEVCRVAVNNRQSHHAKSKVFIVPLTFFNLRLMLPLTALYYYSKSAAHCASSFSETPDEDLIPLPSFAPGASASMLSPAGPSPLPPDVQKGTIVLPAKSYDSMNVSIMEGSLYHHTGNPMNTTS